MNTVELVLDAHATIAESLLWEPNQAVFYWMDVKAPALYRLDPDSLAQRRWPLPADIGAFALVAGQDAALVALRTGLFVLSLTNGTLDLVAPPPFDPALHRFNEGACDAAGRFWVGVMFDPLPAHAGHPPEPATLSTWTWSGGLVVRPDAAELHNGMAWRPDGTLFYLAHSQQQTVFAFPFDAASGHLGERRVFAKIPKALGLPDGPAVDEEGAYWCALHGGGRLHRYAPDGTLLREVELPVSQPTMCAFGGPDLRTLFVSSAADKLSTAQLLREPHAGGLFRLDPGVRGVARPCHVQ